MNILSRFVAWLYASLAVAEGLKKSDNAYARMVGGLVALLITIIVGILVYWQISGGITLTSDTANTSRDGVNTMATTVFGLLPIIAIVVIGSILIGLVIGFGGTSGGRRR